MNICGDEALAQSTFLVLYPFMWKTLGLKGTTLLVFARIFGFCKRGGFFYESRSSTAAYLGISERSVIRSINDLVNCGYITEIYDGTAPYDLVTRCYALTDEITGLSGDNMTSDNLSPPDILSSHSQNNPANLSQPEVTKCHLISKADNKYY